MPKAKRSTTMKRSTTLRMSSRIFSSAANNRIKAKYETEYPPEWNYDNALEFTGDDWQEFIFGFENQDKYDALYLDDELMRFCPPEDERTLSFGDKHQRLIFYGHIFEKDEEDTYFTPVEEQFINEFKIFCKINNHKVPEVDEEILRNLYARKLNVDAAYHNIITANEYRAKEFPLKLSDNVRTMLKKGVIYLAGRDRNLRPIIVVQANLLTQEALTSDTTSLCIFLFEFMIKYIFVPGRIENT